MAKQTVLESVMPSNPLNEEFNNLVKDTMHMWHVPGLSIGVVDGDSVFVEVCLQSRALIIIERLISVSILGLWDFAVSRYSCYP
jgi:hypothetical protein